MKALKKFVIQESERFRELALKTTDRPSRKNVHDLRVSIRKIRTVLKKDSGLKKLGSALGKVRDLDVAIKNAEIYHEDPESLKTQRKVFRKKLLKKLSKRKDINKELRKPKLKPSPAVELIESLKQWSRPLKDEELHPFRKTVKEVRYILEAAGGATEYLKDIQDELGKIHDLAVLAKYYENNLRIEKDRKRAALTVKKLIPPAIHRALQELRELT